MEELGSHNLRGWAGPKVDEEANSMVRGTKQWSIGEPRSGKRQGINRQETKQTSQN